MRLNERITILFSLITLLSFGQYNSEGVVKSRFRPGIMWFNTGWKPGKAERYDRLMFDVTYNDWVGDRKTFKMKGPSMGMNVNWLFDFPIAPRNMVSIGLGPSYGFYYMRHDLPIVYDSDNQLTTFGDQEDSGLFGKRQLVGHQIALPVEFRFRTKGWRHFKVHVGGKIGYQISLNEKARYEQNDETIKEKNPTSKDANRLIYSAHVRMGMRNWAVYASYNFNPFYKNKQSTELHLLQLGLTLSVF
jgi:hypothetical protein